MHDLANLLFPLNFLLITYLLVGVLSYFFKVKLNCLIQLAVIYSYINFDL